MVSDCSSFTPADPALTFAPHFGRLQHRLERVEVEFFADVDVGGGSDDIGSLLALLVHDNLCQVDRTDAML